MCMHWESEKERGERKEGGGGIGGIGQWYVYEACPHSSFGLLFAIRVMFALRILFFFRIFVFSLFFVSFDSHAWNKNTDPVSCLPLYEVAFSNVYAYT